MVFVEEKSEVINDFDVESKNQDGRKPPSTKQLHLKVAYVGISFAVVFVGFNVAQSFMTTIFPGSFGFIVLSILYAVYGISSLFIPSINDALGKWVPKSRVEVISMSIGCIFYLIFVVSLGLGINWLVIITAILSGLGAGLMWISQGVYLTKMVNAFQQRMGETAENHMIGGVTGTFFLMFNFNGIIGNIIAIVFLNNGGSLSTMVWIMCGVLAVGTLLTACSPKIDTEAWDQMQKKLDDSRRSSVMTISKTEKITETLKPTKVSTRKRVLIFLQSYKTVHLTPYLICQGANIAYVFGNFPTLIGYVSDRVPHEHVSKNGASLGSINIAYAFLLYGCGSLLGATFWGRVYDFFRSNLYPMVMAHFVLVSLNLSLIVGVILTPIAYPKAVFPCFLVSGFLFGFTDFLTNAIINNTSSKVYEPEQVPLAFSWYRFCFCVGYALNSGISAGLPRVWMRDVASATMFEKNAWLIGIGIQYMLMLFSVFSGMLLQSKLLSKVKPTQSEEQIDIL